MALFGHTSTEPATGPPPSVKPGPQREDTVARLLVAGDQLEQRAVEVAAGPLAEHVGLLPVLLGTAEHARLVLGRVRDAVALVGHHEADAARGAQGADQAGDAGRGDDQDVGAAVEQAGGGIEERGPERRRAVAVITDVEVAGLVQAEPQPAEQAAAAAGSVGRVGDEDADVQRAARYVGTREQVAGGTRGRDGGRPVRDPALHPPASS